MNSQESLAFIRAYFDELFGKWFIWEDQTKKVIRKGVAIFVVQDQKIRKRHTFVYDESES